MIELGDGLFVTGTVPRQIDYEDTGGAFYLDEKREQVDPIYDDQSIFFDTPEGIVVVLGCAHAGVVNTLSYVQEAVGKKAIKACIGGMHLLNATDERLEQTIDAFRELEVKQLSPCHCAGAYQCATIWQRFPVEFEHCAVGTTFEFERS